MFIDEVTVEIAGGAGGDGCMAFRREKYVPMGGPFGGNGGKGSDIIFKTDAGLNTLLDLRYKRHIKGDKGNNGEGKSKDGRNAEDITVKVPLGTVVKDFETQEVIADLTKIGEEVIVAYGGKGGRGNVALATRANPAPSFCERGEPGEERKIKVELKLLADVGLVGFPSVGKSTIISKISAAKPKIAEYHFTTLSPNLGVVKSKSSSFVVADLPGLIEGASLGAGLGDRFLKHIERTRVIAHVIDMSGVEGRDPYKDYLIINSELENFNKKLIEKPQIIIANKMDIEAFKDNLKEFKKKVKLPVYEISAINGSGLADVIEALATMLSKIEKEPLYEEEKQERHVLYKFKQEKPFTIIRDKNIWLVKGQEVEKVLKMTKFSTEESAKRFANKLRRLGIDDELRKLGAVSGDTIKILDFDFEYKE